MDTFRGFLQQYFAGKLEPYIKSEDAPEENDGPVKVFTGKGLNFAVLSGALKPNSVKNVDHNQKKIRDLTRQGDPAALRSPQGIRNWFATTWENNKQAILTMEPSLKTKELRSVGVPLN